jgi:predicted RNA-binding protein YlqC (UPF0109 family)
MPETAETPKAMVEAIVSALVAKPEAVEITERYENSLLVIEIKVDPEDAGKIIGRGGRVVRALRTLARSLSTYNGGSHVEVTVLD